MAEKGSPLPKFGEWDVNDPASAEGFTVIFNKARDEKKTGGNSQGQDEQVKSEQQSSGQGFNAPKKKWLCCFQPSAAES
ncbi:protein NOI4-like [Panicum virgatum]|uniref:protein NOI4-like n=1 Tax=Panicum virgatum TaxID=38727 RepID=UPI0002AA1F5B|nr:protein NOI4-like [Panicum virgatum]